MNALSNAAPLVSVIILNYNGKNYLQNCLKTVLDNNYPNFEVILVDNASTDSSLKDAQAVFGGDPRLRIVVNSHNLGFSGGNNIGFRYCYGEYVVFLNNDTQVENDWLTQLVTVMQSDPTIGLAQSKIINMHNQEIQNAGWLFSNFLVRKYAVGEKKPRQVMFEPVYEVSVASGASMIAPRVLIEEVGLFEPKIPFFYDDTLLSFKVLRANRKVVAVEGSRIRHIMGATGSWNIEFTTYNLQKAKTCLLFDVYFNLKDLAGAVFVNVSYNLVLIVFLLRKKRWPAVLGTLRGFSWSVRSLPYLWGIRQKHWGKPGITPMELKERFVKIKLPTTFYLMPSKLCNDWYDVKTAEYEKTITKNPHEIT